MTITRTINGVEHAIELTERELATAYITKRNEYERDDVLNYLDDRGEFIMDEHDISDEQLEALVPRIAKVYHEYLNNSEYWWDTVSCAVSDVMDDYEKEREG